MKTLDFTRPTKKEWEDKAAADLNTDNLTSLLNWEPFKGVTVGAYYDASDQVPTAFSFFFSQLRRRQWYLMQEIKVDKNVRAANQKALTALNQGANGVIFIMDHEKNNLEGLFKDILPQHCLLAFKGEKADELGDFFANHFEKNSLLGLVIKGKKVRSGNFNFKSLGIKVKSKHDIVPELINYLEELDNYRHIYGDDFLNYLNISVNLDQKFYQSIALLKALRWLTYLYAQSGDLPFTANQLHLNVTIDISGDYKKDLLINTSSGVAAVTGGANSVSFTLDSKKGGDFDERIARNIGNLIRDESRLNLIKDTTNGSYFLDFLTNTISELSWNQYINQS